MLKEYPCVQIAPGTWEINEFDGVSMFLLVGETRALLIDTGIGIGDLSAFIRTLSNLPLDVLIAHNHRDHAGGAAAFEKVYISSLDAKMGPMLRPLTAWESRLQFAKHTCEVHPDREYPWTEGDLPVFDKEPEVICIEDGYVFNLGGRTATCVWTPGHTPGSLSVIDSQTRYLFCSDACNGILGLGVRPIAGMRHATLEEALEGLERLWAMDFDHERVYNGHTDFRMPGEPLNKEIYPAAMKSMREVLSGSYVSRHKHIASINADVEIVTSRGVELQFHRTNIHGKGMPFEC